MWSSSSTLTLLLTILLLSSPVSPGFFSKNSVLLKSFRYWPCDVRSNHPAWARDVSLISTADGDLDVSGTIVTAVDITSPVKTVVSMQRRVLGMFIPLPCIKDFGSCDYPDLCDYGYEGGLNCPALFHEHDVPCGCPIPKGTYELPGGQFKIPTTRWAGILAGTYKGKVRFYQKDSLLACYDIKFELQ